MHLMPMNCTDVPSLDKAKALENLGGDESLWDDIVEVFLNDMPAQISALEESVHRRDLVTSKRRALALKSAAENVGAPCMKSLATQIELKSVENDIVSVTDLARRIRSEFENLSDLLR